MKAIVPALLLLLSACGTLEESSQTLSDSTASKEILVISDIDDTLKLTNVRASLGTVLKNANNVKDNSFLGMSALLNRLLCVASKDPNCDAYKTGAKDLQPMAYLTAARSALVNFGAALLANDGFPKAEIMNLGLFGDKLEFKRSKVIEQARKIRPDVLILLGDDGELDPLAYEQATAVLKKEFPTLEIHIFIHQLYPTLGDEDHLHAGQRPFLTSIDLAAQLAGLGVLPAESFDAFMEDWNPRWLDKKGESFKRFIPAWADCSEFPEMIAESQISLNLSASAKVEEWEAYIAEVAMLCAH